MRFGKPQELHYLGTGPLADLQRRKNRQDAIGSLGSAGVDQATHEILSWDEYPFAATKEGGRQPDGTVAHATRVPKSENDSQGGSFGDFVKNQPAGYAFWVEVVK